jgi:hypothetical protein
VVRRRPSAMVLRILAVVALALTGCGAGPTSPVAERPYLVAVDDIDGIPSGTVSGTLVVERDCILLEDETGTLLLPLFAVPTAFGPLDGGAPTVDVGTVRLRVGDEVTFAGGTGEVTDGLRSRYPGIDVTRCGVRRFALLGDVVG